MNKNFGEVGRERGRGQGEVGRAFTKTRGLGRQMERIEEEKPTEHRRGRTRRGLRRDSLRSAKISASAGKFRQSFGAWTFRDYRKNYGSRENIACLARRRRRWRAAVIAGSGRAIEFFGLTLCARVFKRYNTHSGARIMSCERNDVYPYLRAPHSVINYSTNFVYFMSRDIITCVIALAIKSSFWSPCAEFQF